VVDTTGAILGDAVVDAIGQVLAVASGAYFLSSAILHAAAPFWSDAAVHAAAAFLGRGARLRPYITHPLIGSRPLKGFGQVWERDQRSDLLGDEEEGIRPYAAGEIC
jgi:hypothetical protein